MKNLTIENEALQIALLRMEVSELSGNKFPPPSKLSISCNEAIHEIPMLEDNSVNEEQFEPDDLPESQPEETKEEVVLNVTDVILTNPVGQARSEYLKNITDQDRIDYVTGNASDSVKEEIDILRQQDFLFNEVIESLITAYEETNYNVQVLHDMLKWSKTVTVDLSKAKKKS